MKKINLKELEEKLHQLYLTGCDHAAYRGEDLEEEILQDISTLLLQVINEVGLEERKISHVEGAMISEGHTGIKEEIEGYNEAVKELNSKKKEIKEKMGLE